MNRSCAQLNTRFLEKTPTCSPLYNKIHLVALGSSSLSRVSYKSDLFCLLIGICPLIQNNNKHLSIKKETPGPQEDQFKTCM